MRYTRGSNQYIGFCYISRSIVNNGLAIVLKLVEGDRLVWEVRIVMLTCWASRVSHELHTYIDEMDSLLLLSSAVSIQRTIREKENKYSLCAIQSKTKSDERSIRNTHVWHVYRNRNARFTGVHQHCLFVVFWNTNYNIPVSTMIPSQLRFHMNYGISSRRVF